MVDVASGEGYGWAGRSRRCCPKRYRKSTSIRDRSPMHSGRTALTTSVFCAATASSCLSDDACRPRGGFLSGRSLFFGVISNMSPSLRDSNERSSARSSPRKPTLACGASYERRSTERIEASSGLALQLHISLDVSFSSDGLMCASPDGPCNDVSGVDPSLRKADGDAADFLDRPADQWRWGFVVFDVVFRRLVFGGGVAFA